MTPNATVTRKPTRNGTTPPATKRVAIYTRQSVDRGDEYGSTDAQREAIGAYVASQRAQGWAPLADRFDDLGYSGSTVERPAFQRLLADIDGGRVDVVAVYKIDRLSRSLLDFTQLMQRFEQKGVEFISVTQQFSTSTSVGRMTLNLLATFAQFERETISERTRDKIAATRRRGMWTGGRPVLGFDAVGGKLVVHRDEAEQVRAIFQLYLERGSLLQVVEELGRRGWHNKSWTNRKEHLVAGRPFNKSSLRHLLRNPLYVGNVTLGAERHKGVHEAIIDPKTFDAVGALLAQHGRSGGTDVRNRWGLLLRGLLRCAVCGVAMSHHFASRGAKRYSYYVCNTAQQQGSTACPKSRVAVGEVERFVVDKIRAIGTNPALVAETLAAAKRDADAKRPELDAQLRKLKHDRTRLDTERRNLVAAVGAGGSGTSSLVARLAEVDEQIETVARRAHELTSELTALARSTVDAADLNAALRAFDPIWNQLFPAERARVLRLLLERVSFDGRSGEVTVAFWPDGVRALAARNGRVQT